MAVWREGDDPQTYQIIGLAMEVHRELGGRLLERAYHRALLWEFRHHHVPHKSEVDIPLFYKGDDLGVPFRADMVCFDDIVVELKAVPQLGQAERRQLYHYLLSMGLKRGLLRNFGTDSLQVERVEVRPRPGPIVPGV